MRNSSVLNGVWVAQMITSLTVFYLVITPIFRLTFDNGGRSLGVFELFILTFLILLPFWSPQLLMVLVLKDLPKWKVIVAWMGVYLLGLGPVMTIAWKKLIFLQSNPALRVFAFLCLSAGMMFVFVMFVEAYTVLVGDVFARVVI